MEELSDLLNLLGSAVGRALQGEENVEELDGKLVEAHSFLKRLSCVPDEGEPDRSRSSELLSASSLQEDQADKLIELCKDTLSHEDVGESSKKLGAQLLVEIARTNTGRRIMRTTGLVPTLSAVLESNCPLETAVQICRVLGNLSYESDEGRHQILAHSDCLIHLHHLAKNSDKSQDPGQRLPVILPRFLLNFTSSNCPEFAEKIAEIGFIDTIVQNVLSTTTNDAVFNSSLVFFVCICEGPTVIKIFHDQADITPAITHILNHTTSPEVTEVALELIRFLVVDSDLSLKLAKSGLCTTIVERVLGRWRSQEFSVHRAKGCNMLINIMSHADSMKYLYALDNGHLKDKFLEWLEDDGIEMKLKVTAALAIGNFACSEENSVTLVANGTSKLLIRLLCKHQNPVKDLEIQHALLGSLRNLTVNPGSRTQLLNEGLLEPCIALTESLSPIPSYSVISKLVPVIRLLVDGSKTASLRIGEDRSLLSKYTEWGSEDNQWLKSASGRLLATLVKNSQSVEVMKNVVEVGGMPLITMMLISHHQKMLNESLITLVLMANVLPKDIVVAQLYTDLIINGIKSSLTESEHPVKVKKNALTLVSSLLKVRPEQFKSMLKDLNFLEALEHESIKDLSEAIQLRDSIENDC
uniref:Rap1 GTPaseGDP dissociation stimulator 1like [Aplysia californica] n=1 Tax=Lepeophtheirus salmonis TaxID=72036 RepID=A0A0K2UBM5_LEPSM